MVTAVHLFNIGIMPSARAASFYRTRYNLEPEDVVGLLNAQNGRCVITKERISLQSCHVDHCHITSQVRGLLCAHANQALGLVNDRPDILRCMKAYVLNACVLPTKMCRTPHIGLRDYQFRRYYGIPKTQVNEWVNHRGGKCDICGTRKSLVVDHCHLTDEIRGMLCNLCNLTIGKLKDDPETIGRAASYLEEYHDG